jgi:hypothetical protein
LTAAACSNTPSATPTTSSTSTSAAFTTSTLPPPTSGPSTSAASAVLAVYRAAWTGRTGVGSQDGGEAWLAGLTQIHSHRSAYASARWSTT